MSINHSRREKIREMRNKGMTFKAIGETFDPKVTPVAVRRMAIRMGLSGRIKLADDGRRKNSMKKHVDLGQK